MKVAELRKALAGLPDDAEVRVQKTDTSERIERSSVRTDMPRELERLVYKECQREIDAIVALVARWPQHRRDIAIGLLGSAIATADMFGVDVEGFLKELRRVEPDPGVLVPPPEKQS